MYLCPWAFTLDTKDSRLPYRHPRSTEDTRNNAMGLYNDEKFKILFHNTNSLAKGTWSSLADDPSIFGGDRRYGAAHLCGIMFV
jgi:hypothetical protein